MSQPLSLSRRRFLALCLAIGAGGVSLVTQGCPSSGGGEGYGGGTTQTGTQGGGTASAGGSANPGVLRYALTAEPTTLDPALVRDGVTIDLLQGVYEGLVGWNEKNEVVPLVAAEMPKISADRKTYTFTIRDGAKFHNGRQITSEDVKYSITRSLDKKMASPVAMNYLDDIVGAKEVAAGTATDLAGVKVIDPKTVQISLLAPRAYFLGKLTYATAYVVAKEEVEKGDPNPAGAFTITEKNSVGSGPFKLASYTPQDRVSLDANADYWGGKPKLTRIERPIVLDTKTVRALYDTGELDIAPLEKGDYEQERDNPDLKSQIKQWDRSATFYLGMNQVAYAPFKNKKVRQAFAHAINKESIVKDVLLGVNEQAESVVPKGIFSYDPAFRGLDYNPEKAKALLAEAGYPDGKGLPPLTLSFREQQPDLIKTAQVVKEQLGAVGVQCNLNEMEWGAYLDANENFKTEFFHMRWSADYIDPQNFLSLLLTTKAPENYTGYSNPQYDALCRKADAETDQAKRLALYRQAEKIVIDDAPWVPLYYQKDLELIKPYVSGIRDTLMGHLPHVTTEVK